MTRGIHHCSQVGSTVVVAVLAPLLSNHNGNHTHIHTAGKSIQKAQCHPPTPADGHWCSLSGWTLQTPNWTRELCLRRQRRHYNWGKRADYRQIKIRMHTNRDYSRLPLCHTWQVLLTHPTRPASFVHVMAITFFYLSVLVFRGSEVFRFFSPLLVAHECSFILWVQHWLPVQLLIHVLRCERVPQIIVEFVLWNYSSELKCPDIIKQFKSIQMGFLGQCTQVAASQQQSLLISLFNLMLQSW